MQDHSLDVERDAGVALPSLSVWKFLGMALASFCGWFVIIAALTLIAFSMRGA